MRKAKWFCALAALLIAGLPVSSHASMVVQDTLETLVADSAIVARVICEAKEEKEDDNGLPATWYTFRVVECLRGDAGESLTIKQFGNSKPNADGLVLKMAGTPTYVIGKEYVLFLAGKSKLGFQAPLGLEQGKFSVFRDDEDREVISNGSANMNMFTGIDSDGLAMKMSLSAGESEVLDVKKGAVQLDSFLSLTRKLVQVDDEEKEAAKQKGGEE